MPRRPPDAIEYVIYTVKRQFSVIQPERCGHARTLQRRVFEIGKYQFVGLLSETDMHVIFLMSS